MPANRDVTSRIAAPERMNVGFGCGRAGKRGGRQPIVLAAGAPVVGRPSYSGAEPHLQMWGDDRIGNPLRALLGAICLFKELVTPRSQVFP